MKYLLVDQESERLSFRPLEPDDFKTWLTFFKNPLWNKYWLTEDFSPEENCIRWFDKAFYRYENDLGGMNALVDKKSGEFIGQCGLLVQSVDNTEELEVAYSMMPQHWNKGYATEAAKKCIDYAFANQLSDSLISIIHENNLESERVALKNRLYLEKHTIYDGNPVKIYRIKNE